MVKNLNTIGFYLIKYGSSEFFRGHGCLERLRSHSNSANTQGFSIDNNSCSIRGQGVNCFTQQTGGIAQRRPVSKYKINYNTFMSIINAHQQ